MNTAIDPAQRLARWRLILGAQAQERLERMGACGLTEEQLLMDQALGAIYGGDTGEDALSGRGAGSGPSSPRISKWLGDVRALFDREIVTVISDAPSNGAGCGSFYLNRSCCKIWTRYRAGLPR